MAWRPPSAPALATRYVYPLTLSAVPTREPPSLSQVVSLSHLLADSLAGRSWRLVRRCGGHSAAGSHLLPRRSLAHRPPFGWCVLVVCRAWFSLDFGAAGFAAAVFAPETPVNGVKRGICTIQQRGMGYAPFFPLQRFSRVLLICIVSLSCLRVCLQLLAERSRQRRHQLARGCVRLAGAVGVRWIALRVRARIQRYCSVPPSLCSWLFVATVRELWLVHVRGGCRCHDLLRCGQWSNVSCPNAFRLE